MVGPQLLAKEEWTTVVFKVGPLGSTFTHKLCCWKTEKMLNVSKALQDWKEAQRSVDARIRGGTGPLERGRAVRVAEAPNPGERGRYCKVPGKERVNKAVTPLALGNTACLCVWSVL